MILPLESASVRAQSWEYEGHGNNCVKSLWDFIPRVVLDSSESRWILTSIQILLKLKTYGKNVISVIPTSLAPLFRTIYKLLEHCSTIIITFVLILLAYI